MAMQGPPKVERIIRTVVDSGAYADEGEVLEEAVQLLQQRDRLRAEIQIGIDELERGEALAADAVFSELKMKAQEIAKRAQ